MQKSFNTFVQPFMSYVTCHWKRYVLHFSFKTPVFKFTCFNFKITTGNFSNHITREDLYIRFFITFRALKVAVTDMSIHQTGALTAREAMNQVLHRLDFKAFQVFYMYIGKPKGEFRFSEPHCILFSYQSSCKICTLQVSTTSSLDTRANLNITWH